MSQKPDQIGAYKFVHFISSGTFGGVWECKHITTGESVACKIIDLEHLRNAEFLPHFKNELIIHSQIRHSAITQLLDVHLDRDNVYLFLELCDSGDLNELAVQSEGLSEDDARRYFRQIMSAISYIHQLGVAHRDIKLENILITRNGQAKLTDFGLCKKQQDGNKFFYTTCGTLVYAAPEIIKEEPYDGMKADIWSAGIVLYAMVANHFPWSTDEDLPEDRLVHETVRQIINGEVSLPEEFSDELQNLLANMLNIDPNERPTAEDVMEHMWMTMDVDDQEMVAMDPDVNVVNQVKSLIVELEKRAKAMGVGA